MSVDSLRSIRDRMVPMFEVTAENYRQRVPFGYPNLIDTPEQGVIGLQLDSSYGLFVTSDGEDLFVEVYRRSPRTDSRAGAGYQKPAGQPLSDRRPLSPDVTDQELRNLIADLMSYFNMQPGLIHITDD